MTKRRIRGEPVPRWTPMEEAMLRTLYPHMQTKVIAVILGINLHRVYSKAARMGVDKTAEYLASPAAYRLRRHDAVGFRHRFAKGHVPANKGMRRPGWAPGRMATTQFKKDQPPRNFLPLQSERLNADGYLDRKVGTTGYPPNDWIGVHRLVWMQAHGDIPAGYIVAFKDRNKMNPALENLECISLRENMRRNTIHNLPAPLKEVIRLRGTIVATITKRMKKREKQDSGSARPPVRDAGSAEGQGEAHGDRSSESYSRRRERDRAIREGRG